MSACIAALETDGLGYCDMNITADDTLSSWDTRRLVDTCFPEITDQRMEFTGRQALVSNAKAKKFLGWGPVHIWKDKCLRGEEPSVLDNL